MFSLNIASQLYINVDPFTLQLMLQVTQITTLWAWGTDSGSMWTFTYVPPPLPMLFIYYKVFKSGSANLSSSHVENPIHPKIHPGRKKSF